MNGRKTRRLVELDSAPEQALSDLTSPRVCSQFNLLLDNNMSVFMEHLTKLITKFDAGTKNFLQWITQLASTETGSRLLEVTRDASALDNAGPSSNQDAGDDVAAGDT